MVTRQIAVAVDEAQLSLIDRLVASGQFASRGEALREAVAELVARFSHERLARESGKLRPDEETKLAEEGLDVVWPEY